MSRISNIIQYVEKLSGHSLKHDEGIHHGDPEKIISGATVCWMVTPKAIGEACKNKDDLIIAHESLYYPYDAVIRDDNPANWKSWLVNRQRRELLESYNLTFLRLHGSLDETRIFNEFAAMLQLDVPIHVDGLVNIYEVNECRFGDLIDMVKRKTGMGHLRIAAAGKSEDYKIKRVGLAAGGMGLFVNVQYVQRLIELGCDVFIAGESDSYGFRFAAEAGIPLIETSHEISENPGLRRFAKDLADNFPDLPVHFYENECIWQWI